MPYEPGFMFMFMSMLMLILMLTGSGLGTQGRWGWRLGTLENLRTWELGSERVHFIYLRLLFGLVWFVLISRTNGDSSII
jgi:hypothetical protein